MKMKKLLALACAAAMSMTLLVGCGGGNEGGNDAQSEGPQDIKLSIWCPQNQIETGIMEKQQNAFQEANKDKWNITWEVTPIGEDLAKENVLRDVEAAADVFFYANDQVVELVNAGAIAKLGGSAKEMVESTMAESVVNTVKVGDDLYGIPFTHNTYFMYYDKTLMTEDDVKTIESIVNKKTDDGVYNFYFESAGGWKLGAWYYGAGCQLFGPNGDDLAAGCDWNGATGLAVTNYLIDLIANPKVGYDGEITVSELVDEHRIGVWFDGSWNYQLYKEKLGDDLGLGVIPTFNVNGKDNQLLSFYGSKCIGVNAHSKAPAAAVAFAEYLGSEEQQMLRFTDSGQAPTNLKAGENEAVLADAVATVLVNQSNTASVAQPTASIFGSRYWTNVNTIPVEINSGEITKDNAQAKLDQLVEKLTMPE